MVPSGKPEMAPLVTIVIPVYKQEDYLYACIRSLQAQTFSHWQAVVVDDASPGKKTPDIVKGTGDPRITCCVHEKNKGLASARNTGFRVAQSEWVLTLDADDFLEPTFLAKCLLVAEQKPGCDVVFTDFMLIGGPDGKKISRKTRRDFKAMLRKQWIPGAGSLIKKKLWADINGYCERDELREGNEDWEFWISAMEFGVQAEHIAEPLYFYRKHTGSMMVNLKTREYKTREFIYKKHKKTFDHYRAGRLFLFEGYYGAASNYLVGKEKIYAMFLGLKAAYFSPDFKSVKKIIRLFIKLLFNR